MDERLRRLERLKDAGAFADVLKYRSELKRLGKGAVLDLNLPHQWEVVGSKNARYGQALATLRGLCANDYGLHPFAQGLARPLTFKETIQARVEQFEREGVAGLWTSLLSTSSAIVYQKGTTKFRIVPLSDDLLRRVPENFNAPFLDVNYDDFESFDELDVTDGDVYGENLTQEQVLKHKGWLAIVEGDKKLLKRYSDIVFREVRNTFNNDVAMAFWTDCIWAGRWISPGQNRLRALCADPIAHLCDCGGNGHLDVNARFTRMRQL